MLYDNVTFSLLALAFHCWILSLLELDKFIISTFSDWGVLPNQFENVLSFMHSALSLMELIENV